jgi:hypothetical protein
LYSIPSFQVGQFQEVNMMDPPENIEIEEHLMSEEVIFRDVEEFLRFQLIHNSPNNFIAETNLSSTSFDTLIIPK